jgi:FSR family fosmidomycin resistance protein-like MFS transporter
MNMAAQDIGAHGLRHDGEVIGLVALAHGTSHFFHLLIPPLFPFLMRDFGLGYAQVGFLMTVFFVISGAGQAAAGFVVDRIGARPVLLFGVGALALSSVALGLAPNYSGLVLAAAIAGVGNAVFHPTDFTLLNRRVSHPRLGHAFSMHGLAGNVGWALAPITLFPLAQWQGWRVAAFVAAAVGALVFVLLWWRRQSLTDVARSTVVDARRGTAQAGSAGAFAFLRSTAVWLCFLFFFFSTGAAGILQNYAPALLGKVYGVDLAFATSCLTAYLVGSAGGMLAGGFAAARFERSESVIALALAASAVVAAAIATGLLTPWTVLGSMAVMGFGVGFAGPSRDLLVRKAATQRFGRASYGRVYGFVYSGLDVGLALSPVIFGPLLDRGAFLAVLACVAVLQVAALLAALLVGRHASAN